MKKITLLLITLLMLTCFSSAANYDLKKTIGGVSVITTIPEGTNVTLKYIKNGNFTRWEVKQGGITLNDETNKTVTFAMPAASVEIEAIEAAEPATQALTICTDGQISETIQMTVGESVTLTPVEGNGKTFSSWQITGLTGANVTSNPLTFTMPNNAVEIIATFIVHTHSYAGTRTCNVNGSTDIVQCTGCASTEEQTCTHEYTISKGTETNGTIMLSATSVKAGGNVTVTITPTSGYEINTITVNGSSKTVSNKAGMTHTFSNVTENQTIAVTFNKKLPTLAQVQVGAYIEYVPTATSVKAYDTYTGYTSANGYQEFNPNATRLWRVMYNNAGQLDIISADGVESVSVDEYGLRLSGKTGYLNAVYVLNSLCDAYANKTDGTATGGRSVGSTNNSVGVVSESNMAHGVVASPYIDTEYQTDYNYLVENNLELVDTNDYWLASRYAWVKGSEYTDFGVRLVAVWDGGYDTMTNGMYRLPSGTSIFSSHGGCLRPIVSLTTQISIIDGSGTEEDPYIISK